MTTLADIADIADILKETRREAGLSQQTLAQQVGVARTTLTRVETLAKDDMNVSARCTSLKPPVTT